MFARQNAIALLALGIALSGTAYAASTIGAQDIRPNAIRAFHIKGGEIGSSELARSLRGQIARSTVGGLRGPQGPAGPAGPAAFEQLQVKQVNGAPLFLGPDEFDGSPIAQCPAGYVVVGTGFNASVGEPGFVMAFGSFVGGFFANFSSISIEAHVQAICARNNGGGATLSKAAALRRFQREVAKARLAMRP